MGEWDVLPVQMLFCPIIILYVPKVRNRPQKECIFTLLKFFKKQVAGNGFFNGAAPVSGGRSPILHMTTPS